MASETKGAIVKIASATDIQSIATVHQQLLQALKRHRAVVLDLNDSENADLTLLQLIEAARRYAGAEGKTIRLSEPASGRLREDLGRGGFLANPSARGFWLQDGGGC